METNINVESIKLSEYNTKQYFNISDYYNHNHTNYNDTNEKNNNNNNLKCNRYLEDSMVVCNEEDHKEMLEHFQSNNNNNNNAYPPFYSTIPHQINNNNNTGIILSNCNCISGNNCQYDDDDDDDDDEEDDDDEDGLHTENNEYQYNYDDIQTPIPDMYFSIHNNTDNVYDNTSSPQFITPSTFIYISKDNGLWLSKGIPYKTISDALYARSDNFISNRFSLSRYDTRSQLYHSKIKKYIHSNGSTMYSRLPDDASNTSKILRAKCSTEDNVVFLGCSNGTIIFFDINSEQDLLTWPCHRHKSSDFDVMQDAKWIDANCVIASVSNQSPEDYSELHMYDTRTVSRSVSSLSYLNGYKVDGIYSNPISSNKLCVTTTNGHMLLYDIRYCGNSSNHTNHKRMNIGHYICDYDMSDIWGGYTRTITRKKKNNNNNNPNHDCNKTPYYNYYYYYYYYQQYYNYNHNYRYYNINTDNTIINHSSNEMNIAPCIDWSPHDSNKLTASIYDPCTRKTASMVLDTSKVYCSDSDTAITIRNIPSASFPISLKFIDNNDVKTTFWNSAAHRSMSGKEKVCVITGSKHNSTSHPLISTSYTAEYNQNESSIYSLSHSQRDGIQENQQQPYNHLKIPHEIPKYSCTTPVSMDSYHKHSNCNNRFVSFIDYNCRILYKINLDKFFL